MADGDSGSSLPAKTKPGHLWKAGQSGNPSGTKQKTDEYRAFVDECRKLTPMVMQTLRDIMNSSALRAGERVQAGKLLLAYAWGQPTQAVELSGKIETEITVIVKGKLPNAP